jgi:hypothetical protein
MTPPYEPVDHTSYLGPESWEWIWEIISAANDIPIDGVRFDSANNPLPYDTTKRHRQN